MVRRQVSRLAEYMARVNIHIVGELEVLPCRLGPLAGADTFAVFSPNWLTAHLRGDAIWHREYLLALKKEGVPARLVTSAGDISRGQRVIWRPTSTWVPHRWKYSIEKSVRLMGIAHEIEDRGGILTPNSRAISCYENKIDMHELFVEVGIRSPRTRAVTTAEEYISAVGATGFPVIVKGAYSSSSRHIYLIQDEDEAVRFWDEALAGETRNKNVKFPVGRLKLPVLVQEYLDIRRDCRVVFVGQEVVLSYWRINMSDAWMSTATRFGSEVVHEPFPIEWEGFLRDTIGRLDFPWGAFDLAWNNDDLSTEPFVLEVSPCFEANPPAPAGSADNYHRFKYESGYEYTMRAWKVIREIATAQVAYLLSQHRFRRPELELIAK